jgi:hypothetical protein
MAKRTKRPRAEGQQALGREKDRRAETGRIAPAARRTAVEGVSMEGVVQKMSGLGLEISRALNGLSGTLVEEVNRLASVREALAHINQIAMEQAKPRSPQG